MYNYKVGDELICIRACTANPKFSMMVTINTGAILLIKEADKDDFVIAAGWVDYHGPKFLEHIAIHLANLDKYFILDTPANRLLYV